METHPRVRIILWNAFLVGRLKKTITLLLVLRRGSDVSLALLLLSGYFFLNRTANVDLFNDDSWTIEI